jgi:hypothetical protein
MSTDFSKTLQYELSRKFIQWEPSSMRTDRRDEGNRRFSQFLRTQQKMWHTYMNMLLRALNYDRKPHLRSASIFRVVE